MELEELKILVKTSACLAQMEAVFFEAMNAGYAADAPKKMSLRWLPGSKIIEHSRIPWRVMDTYHVTDLSRRSGGTTIIAYEEEPVWMMQYLGQYAEEAVPCLKAALHAAYAEKKFFGGRGQDGFVHDGLVYHNDVESSFRATFQGSGFFRGYEKIMRKGRGLSGAPGEVLGWHSYQGMMMI